MRFLHRRTLSTYLALPVLTYLILTALITAYPVSAQGSTYSFQVVNVRWSSSHGAYLAPGDVFTLTVLIKYVGQTQVSGLLATLELPSQIQPYGSYRAVATFDGVVSPSSPYITLKYDLVVARGAPTGLYTLTLRIDYLELSNSSWVSKTEYHVISIAVTGEPDVKILKYVPTTLHVGSQEVNITVGNVGTYVARDAEIAIASQSVVVINGSKYLGDLAPEKNATTGVLIYVPSTLKSSVATLTVTVKYLRPDGALAGYATNLILPIGTTELPKLRVELLNKSVTPGASYVNVLIANEGGGSASNVSLEVSGTDALAEVISTNATDLSPGESILAKVKLHVPAKAVGSVIHLQMRLGYVDDLGVWRSLSTSVTLPVVECVEQVVEVIPRVTVVEGGGGTLRLGVVNEGPGPISGVRLVVSADPPIALVGESVRYLGDLGEGEVKYVNVSIEAPNPSQPLTTSLRVTLSYVGSDSLLKEVSKVVEVVVLPTTPYLGVDALIPSAVVKAPSNTSVTLELLNRMAAAAKSVRIKVVSKTQGVNVLEGEFLVGDIPPKESRRVEVPVVITPSASGTALLSIQVSYVDALGEERSYVLTRALTVVPSEPSITVDLSPKTLYSAEVAEVNMTLLNTGDVAEGAETYIGVV